ncbi:hypothetical protein [Streptomyces sp. NPDC006879]|uniref:amino acid kinase family protein n=1 Tax=Streptomyces sp. NPDC006879 TaxID=3364767 RepID=UPI0036B35EE9
MTGRLPVLMKFGGSAFVELDGYARVARYAVERLTREGRPLVIVVSAMSGTTTRLRQFLDALSDEPPADASAMLLTTGETVSVALLATALASRGVFVRPLSAPDIGLVADRVSDRARLRRAEPAPLRAALHDDGCQAVVVPGGQAAEAGGRTVMLGRNSSDLSVVALAGALGVDHCEIYSDVPGVCTADPYVVPNAQVLDRIGYQGLRLMSWYGAKVVHDSAIDWAERTGVRLRCLPFPWENDTGTGTLVDPDGPTAPAVIVHGSGDVWRFHDTGERRRATQALRGQDLRTTPVDTHGGTYLVVPHEGGDQLRSLTSARLCEDLRLVTVLTESGDPRFTLVRRPDAESEAQHQHDLLYPPGQQARTAIRAKSRSPHSAALIGGPDGRGLLGEVT